MASLNSFSDARSKRVLKAEDSNHSQALLNILHIFSGFPVVVLARQIVPLLSGVVNMRNEQGTKALFGVVQLDFASAVVSVLLVHLFNLTVFSDVVLTFLNYDFRSTFAEDANSVATIHAHCSGSSLTGRAEWNSEDGLVGVTMLDLFLSGALRFREVLDQANLSDITLVGVCSVLFCLDEGSAIEDDGFLDVI